MEKVHQDNPYRSKDVCDERHKTVETKCTQHEKEITKNTDDIKTINRKMDATLIFVIATLVAVLVNFATRMF